MVCRRFANMKNDTLIINICDTGMFSVYVMLYDDKGDSSFTECRVSRRSQNG